MSGCRENSPTGFAQVRDYDTFLIYKLLYENTFFLKNLGAFKDFRDFFMETSGLINEFSFQIQIDFCDLWRLEVTLQPL